FVLSGILTGVLVATGPGPALIALIISLLATTLFTGMVVQLVADVRDGRRDASAAQLLRAVGPMMGQLILVGIASAVGLARGIVVRVIVGVLAAPLSALAAAVLYFQLRDISAGRPAGKASAGEA